MRTEAPPGRRTTYQIDGSPGTGGSWKTVRDKRGAQHFIGDLTRFLEGLGESDRLLVKQEFKTKLRKAERGELTYGDGSQFDVCQMRRHDCVLELRLDDYGHYPDDDREQGDPVRRHTRMYFTEPVEAPGNLLRISLESKVPGPAGLAEQNCHIDAAYGRLGQFELYLYRNGITLATYCE